MKHKLLLLFFLVLNSIQTFSQDFKITPVIDERTELLSIIFRLAGVKEYVNNDLQKYAAGIDNYFRTYKNENVILFAKKLRNEQGVSYDAVMCMAIHLEIKNNVYKLKEKTDAKSLDKRWGSKAKEFIQLLNEFYKKTNFHKFFIDNSELYKNVEKEYTEVLDSIDLNWFEKYYGTKPKGTFNLIISLSNGGMSYGPKIINSNGTEDMYAIIATYETDSTGNPICSQDFAETIIHEFNHSFCNNLIDKYISEFNNSAEKYYMLIEEKMKNQAYGNAITMQYEILVRASVIRYLQEHKTNSFQVNSLISIELNKGFFWIEHMINLLKKYSESRSKYPTLETFIPRIINLQDSINPRNALKNYKRNLPEITSFSISNNDQNVDPNLKELVVTFDRPMFTGKYGINYSACGESCFPKVSSVTWNPKKNYELIIKMELKPNKHYSMLFPPIYLLDENGFMMKDSYVLEFKTR